MFTCMLVYQMSIQIYNKISILRKCSKVKLRWMISLGLGLKEVKIVGSVEKTSVNACLSNGNPNLLSSFNSKKLVKSETPSCGFVRVWLKGAENSFEKGETSNRSGIPEAMPRCEEH